MSDAEKEPIENPVDAPESAGAGEKPAETDPAAAVTAERDDLRDKLLRLAAEMENLRKRTEREVKEAAQYAVTSFARDMLTVGDNLQRALAALPADQREGAGEGLAALINGVEMTEREMQNVLTRHGMKKLEPKGEKFDPNFHQAMFEIPDDSVPNGTVKEVVQAGYTIGGRVLRPALVGVSKGGAKAQPAADDDGQPRVDKTA
ncbi:MAG: nucleotide exchange factor GrpE [Rhodobiaceae bacterium]|nr:nucleotide exchange factor GrpE [Rhodobiaceae bacterium]MCC0055406.1 nucleotide exchange factor GrpE [Rhodobiaceae bacterium]